MPSSLYEHPSWQNRPDQLMRPGGLAITEQALAYCELKPGMVVLDVGCGTGKALREICGAYQLTGIGIDISNLSIRRAQAADPLPGYALADGQNLPFASQSVDLLLSECTLSIFRMEQALAAYARVLKPGGFAIINDVYARKEEGVPFLRQLPAESCIGGAMPERTIRENIAGCGLRIIVFQDCSEHLRDFPFCNLTGAGEQNSFDLFLAAAKARLGYYFMVVGKV